MSSFNELVYKNKYIYKKLYDCHNKNYVDSLEERMMVMTDD